MTEIPPRREHNWKSSWTPDENPNQPTNFAFETVSLKANFKLGHGAVRGHACPSPADKLRDLAEHASDPWMARQLADIAADLDRPRRPGRPEGRSSVVRRRDAVLRRVRMLPAYRALSGEAAARAMRRDFARWVRFRDSSSRPHASPAAEWCELADDLGFVELPAIKTLKNIFARD